MSSTFWYGNNNFFSFLLIILEYVGIIAGLIGFLYLLINKNIFYFLITSPSLSIIRILLSILLIDKIFLFCSVIYFSCQLFYIIYTKIDKTYLVNDLHLWPVPMNLSMQLQTFSFSS